MLLDLDEETITSMMDEQQTYEEPFLPHEIEGVFGKLEPEGRMPVEASEMS